MVSARDVPLLAVFDVESSGVDVENDRIVSAFIGLMNKSGEWVEKNSWLVNPGIEIPQGAIDVHGITNERVKAEGAEPRAAISEMIAVLNEYHSKFIPVSAYNASFDYSMLKYEALRYGLKPFEPIVVVDAFIIDRAVDKWRKGKRTLTVTSKHYGIDIGENAHDAEADCVAAGKLGFRLLQHKFVADKQMVELHAWQVRAAASQAASFQEHLRKSNPDAIVNGVWPVR